MRMISFNKLYVAGPESNQRPMKPQSDSLSTLCDLAAMYTWAAAWQNQPNGHCVQRRHRSACAFVQSDQSLRCPHEEKLGPQLSIERTAKCEDSDQTGRVSRLIWVFAGHKGYFVGLVMKWLTLRNCILIFASGLRNKPHFWRPGSLAQSTVSLTAEPVIACSSPSPATYW